MVERGRETSPRWGDPIHLIAFGFGAGASPVAPGTLGSLAAFPFWLLLRPLSPSVYLALLGLLFALGVWVCGRAARELGVHDHSGIVWDEMVGMWLALFLVPKGWLAPLGVFALFRLFDILKPWPIGLVDRGVRGGLGIMLDDLLAGALAWLVLHGALYLAAIAG
jgi:phosphatidylglycerophosphatase A